MKHLFLLSIILTLMSGCSKPPAEEYMKKAEDAEKAGLWSVALENYQKLVADQPGSPLAETAMFRIATILHNSMQNFQGAVDAYKQYLTKYPDGKRDSTALFLGAFLYHNELKNLDSAGAYYKRFLEKYPTSELANSAQYELQNLGKSPEELLPKPVVAEKPAAKPAQKARPARKK